MLELGGLAKKRVVSSSPFLIRDVQSKSPLVIHSSNNDQELIFAKKLEEGLGAVSSDEEWIFLHK